MISIKKKNKENNEYNKKFLANNKTDIKKIVSDLCVFVTTLYYYIFGAVHGSCNTRPESKNFI